jgi:ATP-dependent Clp protease adaptor protein ClpS
MPELPQPVAEPEVKTHTRYAPRWRVLGLNDDFTPMDYVIRILIEIFNKKPDEAFDLMMEVHETGAATFYVGTREACELKVEMVHEMNRSWGYALAVILEPCEEGSDPNEL